MKARTPLIPSWQLLPASMQLVRNHLFSIFWLTLIPTVLYQTATFMVSQSINRSGLDLAKTTDSQLAQAIWHDPTGRHAFALLGLAALWWLVVYPATIVMAVRAVRGGSDEPLTALRTSARYYLRLYGLAIVIALLICVGFIALIVPGLILYRRYALAPYYLVERNCGIREALRLSAKQNADERGAVWGTLGVVLAMAFAAAAVSDLPIIGLIAGPAVGILYFFGLPLRHLELSKRHPAS